MLRHEPEHILRAAGSIANERDIIVVGSQAVFGACPHAASSLLRSMEADLYPREHPERAELIEGSIGDGSQFHLTFGYYAHGVSPETAILPTGWHSRLVLIDNENTCGIRGWCLDLHDLAVSKLAAGRDKDIAFVGELGVQRLLEPKVLLERIRGLSPEQADTSRVVLRAVRAGVLPETSSLGQS